MSDQAKQDNTSSGASSSSKKKKTTIIIAGALLVLVILGIILAVVGYLPGISSRPAGEGTALKPASESAGKNGANNLNSSLSHDHHEASLTSESKDA